MNAQRTAIGIDIGGTKTAVALVDHDGRILSRRTFPTQAAQGFNLALDRISEAIRQATEQAGTGHTPVGIGIGCAGPVDPQRGRINNPFTLTGWDQCDIVAPLHARFGIPVLLENDADAAAVGEGWVGAGRDRDPFVMLTFGTGVGGAVIRGGAIHRGVDGEHPELGHLVVRPDGPACYCGTRGCLESIASGTAIAASGEPFGFTTAREVFQAAEAGNPDAAAILDQVVEAVGIAAWTVFHTLLPQRLILGGGIMETEFDRFAGIARRMDSATQFSRSKVDLARATLGNDAGLLGGARLAFRAAPPST